MANALNKVALKGLSDGTDGQIITYDASGNPVAVGPGTDGQVLTSTGAGSPPAFEDAAGGTALTGSTNNTVCTVTGANAIQGEANLIFDGSLGIALPSGTTSPSGKLTVHNTDDANVNVFEVYNDNENISGSLSQTSAGDGTLGIWKNDGTLNTFFRANGDSYINGGGVGIGTTSPEDSLHIKTGKIRIENAIVSNNDSTISYDNSDFLIDVDPNNVRGSSQFQIKIDTVAALTVDDSRNVKINDGDLQIGTAGHGIDFSSSQTPATGMASELLDHYEEGTFTPAFANESGTAKSPNNSTGKYTRIGRVVHISVFANCGGGSTLGGENIGKITGLPFNANSEPNSSGLFLQYGGGANAQISSYTACYVGEGGTQIKFKQSISCGTGNINLALTYTI